MIFASYPNPVNWFNKLQELSKGSFYLTKIVGWGKEKVLGYQKQSRSDWPAKSFALLIREIHIT